MLLYQRSETAITELMTSLMTAYSAYFNARHKRRGSLFESTYKAVLIYDDVQLMHITRYICLNYSDYTDWSHSSYGDYLSEPRVWMHPEQILELSASVDEYSKFVRDYEDMQRERDEIKNNLYGR